MPDILKTIKERRSVRRYQAKQIPDELVDELKQALIWAPSAGNLQARKFYFIFNREIREYLAGPAALHPQPQVAQAPLVIVACADEEKMEHYGERGKEIYTIADVSASIQNAMLLAQERGLGSCWVGAFKEAEVRKILNLPKNLRPLVVLPVGYPAETPAAKERVSVGEAVEVVE